MVRSKGDCLCHIQEEAEAIAVEVMAVHIEVHIEVHVQVGVVLYAHQANHSPVAVPLLCTAEISQQK